MEQKYSNEHRHPKIIIRKEKGKVKERTYNFRWSEEVIGEDCLIHSKP